MPTGFLSKIIYVVCAYIVCVPIVYTKKLSNL